MHPKTQELVSKTPSGQAERALKNLKLLAESAGFTLDKHTIKTTVFLTKMAHFAEINVVYTKYFGLEDPPARSCVAAHELPKGALFEIEAVFFKP